jgi:hypothetical protein
VVEYQPLNLDLARAFFGLTHAFFVIACWERRVGTVVVQVRTGSGGFLEVLVLLMRSGGFWCSFGRCAFSARLKVLCHPTPPHPSSYLAGMKVGARMGGLLRVRS